MEKPISLELYASDNIPVARFEVDSSLLTSHPAPPFSELSMTNKTGTSPLTAHLSIEMVHPVPTNRFYPPTSDNWVPVTILESSLPLPHSSLHLQVVDTGYAFYREKTRIFFIPFATIEASSVQEREIVEIVFNREGCPWSHWVKLQVFCVENSPLWNLLASTPQLTHHSPYSFVYFLWIVLQLERACYDEGREADRVD